MPLLIIWHSKNLSIQPSFCSQFRTMFTVLRGWESCFHGWSRRECSFLFLFFLFPLLDELAVEGNVFCLFLLLFLMLFKFSPSSTRLLSQACCTCSWFTRNSSKELKEFSLYFWLQGKWNKYLTKCRVTFFFQSHFITTLLVNLIPMSTHLAILSFWVLNFPGTFLLRLIVGKKEWWYWNRS